jgi:protein-S-isoprenylcysteine O-methyltransferase Ste14
VLQLLAGGGIVACGLLGLEWPEGAQTLLGIAGLVLAAAGLVLCVLGVRALGSSFTPLPLPRAGELRRQGIYRLVRHPIYGGVIILALGWSLLRSPLAVVPTALLTIVFELKSRREEVWLDERYPEYAAYRAATRRRFLPWVV